MEIRKSNSSIQPPLVQQLQGGWLLHFNITTETNNNITSFNYDEITAPITATIAEIETFCVKNGCVLSNEHKTLLK